MRERFLDFVIRVIIEIFCVSKKFNKQYCRNIGMTALLYRNSVVSYYFFQEFSCWWQNKTACWNQGSSIISAFDISSRLSFRSLYIIIILLLNHLISFNFSYKKCKMRLLWQQTSNTWNPVIPLLVAFYNRWFSRSEFWIRYIAGEFTSIEWIPKYAFLSFNIFK